MKENISDFFRQNINPQPVDLHSAEALLLKKRFFKFPDEAVYIYSLREGRMIYADGWQKLIGIKDDKISLLDIVGSTHIYYLDFMTELNEKAFIFMRSRATDFEKYSFAVELKKVHVNKSEIPILLKIGVFEIENNEIVSIIGNFRIIRSLYFGKTIRYFLYGPDVNELENYLNKELKHKMSISYKQREALLMIAKGYSFKEVAANLNVSISAIEKRILPLYTKFDVKSLNHLISFAYENLIIP